jgi:hypothetical protein
VPPEEYPEAGGTPYCLLFRVKVPENEANEEEGEDWPGGAKMIIRSQA